jgi:hypothetical protein
MLRTIRAKSCSHHYFYAKTGYLALLLLLLVSYITMEVVRHETCLTGCGFLLQQRAEGLMNRANGNRLMGGDAFGPMCESRGT